MLQPGPLADLMLVVRLVVLLLVCGAFIGIWKHVDHVLSRGEDLDRDLLDLLLGVGIVAFASGSGH